VRRKRISTLFRLGLPNHRRDRKGKRTIKAIGESELEKPRSTRKGYTTPKSDSSREMVGTGLHYKSFRLLSGNAAVKESRKQKLRFNGKPKGDREGQGGIHTKGRTVCAIVANGEDKGETESICAAIGETRLRTLVALYRQEGERF